MEIDMKEIKGFINAENKVTAMPSKKKKKLLLLAFIAEQIPADAKYAERDFNQFLNGLITYGDYATLRRELVDYKLVNRSADGREYSLNAERPSADELVTKYC